ncbi:MAG: hypothetical protein ACFFC7_08205 [Candidatus Hermodarchaeota archaeon]
MKEYIQRSGKVNRNKIVAVLGVLIIIIFVTLGMVNEYLLENWLISSQVSMIIAKLGILAGLIISLLGLIMWQEEVLKETFSKNASS